MNLICELYVHTVCCGKPCSTQSVWHLCLVLIVNFYSFVYFCLPGNLARFVTTANNFSLNSQNSNLLPNFLQIWQKLRQRMGKKSESSFRTASHFFLPALSSGARRNLFGRWNTSTRVKRKNVRCCAVTPRRRAVSAALDDDHEGKTRFWLNLSLSILHNKMTPK